MCCELCDGDNFIRESTTNFISIVASEFNGFFTPGLRSLSNNLKIGYIPKKSAKLIQ